MLKREQQGNFRVVLFNTYNKAFLLICVFICISSRVHPRQFSGITGTKLAE